MEKIIKSGKVAEDILESIYEEHTLSKEDIVYLKNDIKKGLFKNETIEIIAYKKIDIYKLVKDYLKEVINNLGLDVSFEQKNEDDRVIIKMYSDNNGILIGYNGNTIRALETLAKQKIYLETGIRFKINLDVENYKDKKAARLIRTAKQIAKDVAKSNVPAQLDNMNAYERRIIHNALTNFKGVTTKSEGVEPNRHIVISPVKNS